VIFEPNNRLGLYHYKLFEYSLNAFFQPTTAVFDLKKTEYSTFYHKNALDFQASTHLGSTQTVSFAALAEIFSLERKA
jgi:hypothetical protein